MTMIKIFKEEMKNSIKRNEGKENKQIKILKKTTNPLKNTTASCLNEH